MIQEVQFMSNHRLSTLKDSNSQCMIPEEQENEGIFMQQTHVVHVSYHSKTKMQMYLVMQYLALLRHRLPNMPHSHLVTVLLSPSHQNLILLKGRNLLSGLTFCKIQRKKAIELSLMASSKIYNGHGTFLLNHLKSLAQARGVRVIATHADNEAIGFYEKLGFSLTQFIENNCLHEKQFSNSTIMQTRINMEIDYFKLRPVLKKQKQSIINLIHQSQKLYSARVTTSSRKQVIHSQNFKINPENLSNFNSFWGEHRRLIQSKEQKIYRQFLIHINRLIDIAQPEIIEMNSQLHELSFLEFNQPIQLVSIRQRVITGHYETQAQLFADLSNLLINCRKLYKNNLRVIDNIQTLQKEIEIIQEEQK